jgi:Fur family ferric uptake transcriptional regulator
MTSQTLHGQEKEQFVQLFKQDRIRQFEDRLAILDAFLRCEQHVTAHALADLVSKQHLHLSVPFVEETMELMCRYGFAQAIKLDEGIVYYEHRHLGQHHDHMICTKCQAIIEFENQALEQLQRQIAQSYGFHVLQHKMELYGICQQCQELRAGLIGLDAARSGERLTIKAFDGGAKVKLRLLSMGLRIGDEIEIITNQGQGQLVVAVDFKRLVLGRGLSQKILVAPADAGA